MNLSNLKPNWAIVISVLVGVLVGIAAVCGYVYFQYQPMPPQQENQAEGGVMQEEEAVSSATSSEVDIFVPPENEDTSIVLDEGPSANLRVDWAEPAGIGNEAARAMFITGLADNESVGAVFDEALEDEYGFSEYAGMWEMGTVRGGGYDGAEIYLLKVAEDAMGPAHTYSYMMKERGSNMLRGIDDPPSYTYSKLLSLVPFYPNIRIPELEMPETLTLTNGETLYQFPMTGFDSPFYRHESNDRYYEAAKTRDGRSVYWNYSNESAEGCLLVFAADGREYHYAAHVRGKGGAETGYGSIQESLVPSVTWKDDYENASEYTYRPRGGCGSYGCASVVEDNEVMASGDLITVGTTSEGDDIVAPKNPSKHPIVQSLYDTWYDLSWYSYSEGKEVEKPSMEEFLERFSVPVFFWKDPFDRWNVYKVSAALPMAECGKPVIYLYPEETTDVRVALPSFIDVTVSEPEYPDGGWKVTAQPNGQLNYCDGNMYGSLYWEGNGATYDPPTTGFVVVDGEVDIFLRVALARYGLNETESREFREFWMPQLTGAPFYRISFLTDDWNEAVPLNVSPRPDTFIRIFMDWEPLQAPESIAPPDIEAPEREGFTLVEWGGLLY